MEPSTKLLLTKSILGFDPASYDDKSKHVLTLNRLIIQ
jgi:hypothetical protein